jgi:predicted ABC-type transport system involved in lysophospholipase L1 biosynthesis ATPase subunit
MLFDLHRKQNTILVIVTHNTDLAARCSVRFSLNSQRLETVSP